MKTTNINDLAIETLTDLNAVRSLSQPYNDYGSVLGVRDELELVERELTETLSRCGLRLSLAFVTRSASGREVNVALRCFPTDELQN